MPPTKPVVLVDNVFDRINLYPLATLSFTGGTAAVGREPKYAADYRRERSYCQASAAAANQGITSDLGAGNTATVDSLWLDRGHNLWGKTVNVQVADDPTFTVVNHTFNFAVPALGTLGGDPTTGFCVTEEGSLYTLFAITTARRYFMVRVTDVWQPIITGVVLGKRIQFLGYSSVVDEDAGDRSTRSEASQIPGYSGDDRTYSARTVEIKLALIGATEYDGTMRTLRRLLFDVNQAAVVCMNYGINPERAWLYKYSGTKWSSPKSRTYRSVSISLSEYGPAIR